MMVEEHGICGFTETSRGFRLPIGEDAGCARRKQRPGGWKILVGTFALLLRDG
jgi:hypothetical protein